MGSITQWSATSWGVLALTVGYAYLLARALLSDKRKANESHVKSVEKSQDRLYSEIEIMRKDLKELQQKLEGLQARYEVCATSLAASLTRLELLETFRDIAEKDNPTGATKRAMPPANGGDGANLRKGR